MVLQKLEETTNKAFSIVLENVNKWELVTPNFIYNRFDILASDNSLLLTVIDGNDNTYYIPIRVDGHVAYMGTWLSNFGYDVLSHVSKYIFRCFDSVNRVKAERVCIKDADDVNNKRSGAVWYQKENDWHIDFPSTEEELNARLSQKSRYNIRREKRLIQDAFNEVHYMHEKAEDAYNIIDLFFDYKKISHSQDYHMSSKEYIKRTGITDLYYLEADGQVLALIMSCNQCPYVYCENMAYNQSFQSFSPGKIVYDWYLKELIKEGKRGVFLSGGNLEYKTRYGSKECIVYDLCFYKSQCLYLFFEIICKLPSKIWTVIPENGKTVIRRILQTLKIHEFNHV